MKVGRSYVLVLLTVILAFNYLDRISLGIVLQDIKVDLHLSDSQLGFLTGIAFALFYSLLGLPIARWADQGHRVGIISLSVALWSVAVILCGSATSFVQMMVVRVVAAVGESGCVPASLSLISGYFSREERPRAMSFYMQGISASLILGFFAAGWLDEKVGWRATFALIGLPGLVLALLARQTIHEPVQLENEVTRTAAPPPSFREVCFFLWKSKAFRHLLYSATVIWFFGYGTLQWTPAYFERSFGLKPGELGSWLAVIYGVMNVIGLYLGGEWATRYALRNERRQLKAMAIVTLVSGVLTALVYLPSAALNAYVAFAWLALASVAGAAIGGPQFSVMQELVPPRMRAVAVAIVYLVGNLIGMGVGPWTVGVVSDALRPWFGEESLRYAIVLMCPVCGYGAWHLWAAARSVTVDVDRAKSLARDYDDVEDAGASEVL